MDESLHCLIAQATQRLLAEMEVATPQMAQPVGSWMRALAGGNAPEAYFTHTLAFPTLLLPWWVAQSLGHEPEPTFQADIAYSSINGYYFIRMIDNVMDGEATVEAKLLPALAFFHTEFQAAYQTQFAPSHPFWALYRTVWFGTAEAAIHDARLDSITLAMFEQASAQKVRAALIPVAAVCYRHARADLIGPWSEFVYRMGKWHQMLNDTFDWHKDIGNGNMTYFLSEAQRNKCLAETPAEWIVRTGFRTGCDTLRSLMREAQQHAATLNCQPLAGYLTERSTQFERRAHDTLAGFDALAETCGGVQMSAPATYPDLFEMGQRAFVRFREEFRQYGVEADPGLELHRSQGMLCYYDFSDRQIYLSMPDLKATTGKLQLLMFRQMLCAESNDELLRFLAIFIPFIVAHEMTHHFRHRAGLFGTDSWHEEQLANQMAAAVNKHRIAPAERAFAVQFLQRAVKKLGDELGLGENAVDSYYDIAHALQASNNISATEMDNFRLVQGVAPDFASVTSALRVSGAFAEVINQRLDKRDALISSFNQEYASNPTRYVYYQMGWVYLAIKGTEASYVDEFAREHLNRASLYLSITLPKTATPGEICALYKASRVVVAASSTLSRYFYKRYRTHLLKYIEQNHSGLGQADEGQRSVNFDVLAIWDDRNNDPLNFLAGMVRSAFRELFPAAIGASALLAGTRLPEDLPTPADRLFWSQVDTPESGAAQLTIDLFQQFDRLELFRSLPPEIILELGKKSYRVRYAAGETLVWQGEFNNDIFILLEGQLETSVQGHNKNATIGPGELFGEIAWLTHGSRSASVRAVLPSICLVIKERDLQILAYQSPSILQSIAATLARRLRATL